MMSKRYVVAVDPDSERYGVAVIDTTEKAVIYTAALTMPELAERLISLAAHPDEVTVVLETQQTTHVWHKAVSERAAMMIARAVGRCQQAEQFVRMVCNECGVQCVNQPPCTKIGLTRKDGKITRRELQQFVTYAPSGTPETIPSVGQDAYDAILIGWVYCGYHIRFSANKPKRKKR